MGRKGPGGGEGQIKKEGNRMQVTNTQKGVWGPPGLGEREK